MTTETIEAMPQHTDTPADTHLCLVVPCYNEQEVLADTTLRLTQLLQRLRHEGLATRTTLLYVDDGSRDGTWPLIEAHAQAHPEVKGLKLAHNVGHQHALWAGLTWAEQHCDVAVSIDADLQDDIEAIPHMLHYYHRGIDIVYGVRRARRTDTWFKRTTALAFYRLMQMMDTGVIYNHADFRLMSRRTLHALLCFEERNLFLRGMVASLGFPSAMVYYDRSERQAGESKYPLRRMLSFAIDGITSFSVRPLQCITYLGLVCMCIAACVIVYGLWSYLQGRTVQGWTSQLVSIWFVGGAMLLACGVLGEYVGKIYREVKHRPRYFVEQETHPDNPPSQPPH